MLTMIIVFFMPQATIEEESFIVQHGGMISTIVEFFTLQIGKRDTGPKGLNDSLFHAGAVFDF